MPDHPLLPAALAALDRPVHHEELLRTLGQAPGTDASEAVLDALLGSGRVLELDDGRVASGEALLDGLVLWHRLDAVELATGRVGLGLDVLPALAVVPEPAAVQVRGRARRPAR